MVSEFLIELAASLLRISLIDRLLDSLLLFGTDLGTFLHFLQSTVSWLLIHVLVDYLVIRSILCLLVSLFFFLLLLENTLFLFYELFDYFFVTFCISLRSLIVLLVDFLARIGLQVCMVLHNTLIVCQL